MTNYYSTVSFAIHSIIVLLTKTDMPVYEIDTSTSITTFRAVFTVVRVHFTVETLESRRTMAHILDAHFFACATVDARIYIACVLTLWPIIIVVASVHMGIEYQAFGTLLHIVCATQTRDKLVFFGWMRHKVAKLFIVTNTVGQRHLLTQIAAVVGAASTLEFGFTQLF